MRSTLSEPGGGKVLVVDGGGSLRRALFGDNIAALAVQNGWAGVIIYGAIRDSEQVIVMGLVDSKSTQYTRLLVGYNQSFMGGTH